MDEEEELENTLIGQQEEAPAVNTGDALMGNVNNDPSFLSRLGSFFNASGMGGAGLPPTFTPPSQEATQATAGTDISPITLESLGLESPQQRIFKESMLAEKPQMC